MALRQQFEYKTLPLDGYVRAVLPQVGQDKVTMSFGLWFYPSEAAASKQENMLTDMAITVSDVPYDHNGPNIFEQCYVYAKTMPEMEGAVDVFDEEPGEPISAEAEPEQAAQPAAVEEARNALEP